MPSLDALARHYRGRPALVFDRDALERNLRECRDLAALGCSPGMAVKAFPDPEVLRFCARYLEVFDCSNETEAALVPPGRLVSLTNPVGDADAWARVAAGVVVVDSPDQAAELHRLERPVRYLVRLDLFDLFGRPEPLSKYGCSVADLPEICRSRRHEFLGFHAHRQSLRDYGGNLLAHETAFDRAEMVRRVLDLGYEPRMFNLGGGLYPEGIRAEVERIRGFCPSGMRIVVEPGDYWFRGCGFAVSGVRKVQDRRGYLHVTTDISREAHLKWSNRESRSDRDLMLFDKEPANCTVHGPSCRLNGEVLTTAHIPEGHAVARGDLLFWENVSPYSSGWNTGFNGIPPAEVVFTGLDGGPGA